MAQSYWLLGSRLTILADAGVTGGQFDLIEGQFPAGAQTPLHRHNRYIEQLYVLEGEYTVWAGTQTAVLRAGETFTIPSGTAHVVAATGSTGARGLAVAAPSAFAHLIRQVGTLDETGVPPSPEAIDMALFERISAAIGDEVLGPPGTLPTA